MSDKVEEALAGRGLAVREVPALPGFGHRVFILVEKKFAAPAVDVSDQEVPLLSISAAWSREQACTEFLEWCYQTTTPTKRFGIGSTDSEARQRAKAKAYEALISDSINANLRPQRPGGDGSVKAEELDDINGQLVTTLYHDGSPHKAIVAELTLGRPPYYLAAVGCGPSSRERAILGVFTKLNAFLFRRRHSAEWITVALDPPNIVRGDSEIGLHPPYGELQTRVWSDDHELTVASAKLPEVVLHSDEGLVGPVDAVQLGLRAPTHFALAHGEAEVALSRRFHENSKLHVRHRPLPLINHKNMSQRVHEILASAKRDYRFTRLEIPLTPRAPERPQNVASVLSKRRSAASFSTEPLDLYDLAYILLASYGVTGRINAASTQRGHDGQPISVGLRATPSAGGLNSNDIFVLVDQMADIDSGLYYFNPDLRCLQLVNSRARMGDLAESTGYAERVRSSSVTILLAGAFSRIQWKYWERGYRMVLLDCGHLAQSLVIAATELDIVAHPIGGFVDEQVNALIGFDGINDSVLHLLVLGKRKKAR
ncbi:SagB/ThcOx family dehydrogenase [Corynebacterium cystitidis]|uniref:SagB/ThcOx family dehydrogenase n=1 Tax=Corynebacterium cystitidis TaxID=35757 RepID=UPI00211E6478|nr:SagB/ThcOx family dehydrogenase [Corynebacterium cystitidis]